MNIEQYLLTSDTIDILEKTVSNHYYNSISDQKLHLT